MEKESALILMQEVIDNYSMNFAQKEAWQTVKAELAQQTHNSKSMPCPSCGRTLQPLWFCPNEKCENHECN